MKKIKKQNPKIVGSKPRKIKWHRSKDGHDMPYAHCEEDIANNFYILCEVMWITDNVFSFYIDMPGYSSHEIQVRGFEQAIERAEQKILAQIGKNIKQLSRWV